MKLAIKLCLWLLAFIPLIVDPNVFFPYTSGKNLMIESSLVLAGILILINFLYSNGFREEIMGKAIKYLKQPIVISILVFFSFFIISTIFAVDKYSAFWGSLARAEGLAGLCFYFSFLVFSLLTFEKQDWLWFFKFSLFVSLILLGKEFVEFFHNGIARPGSFAGNPTFLAGYLLFSIISSLIVISNEVNSLAWKGVSLVTIILSILGIFITQTRGTILGLALGIVVVLIYSAFKGKDVNYKIFNLRKVAIILLTIGIIFSGAFAITRKNEVWQKVPGLSRLAVTHTGDEEDLSTQVRLFVYQSALQSVNPMQGNMNRLITGWGPENFLLVDSKYYNPKLYQYETVWHDRAHNKFLDVLVMNGIFGLLAYLAIWFTFFKSILKGPVQTCFKCGFPLTNLALLSFGTTFLTHLMFVFDQISTSISFFAILAFTAHLASASTTEESKRALIRSEMKERGKILAGTFLVVLTVFLAFIYFKSTLPGYFQMHQYTVLIENAKAKSFEKDIDFVFAPFTLPQMNIRRNFLEVTNKLYNKNSDEINLRLLKKAIFRAEEYLTARPGNFQFMTTLADLYSRKGNSLKDMEYLKKGEELLRQVLFFAPNRPDINLKLALNLLYQEKFMEAFAQCETIFRSSLTVVAQDQDNFEGIYTSLVKYFYEQKDKANFIKVANRLKANNYSDSASLDKILDYLNTTGTWPRVDFN